MLVVIIKQCEEAISLVAYNGKSRICDKKVNSGAKQSYSMLKSVLTSTVADAILLEELAVSHAKIEAQGKRRISCLTTHGKVEFRSVIN